MIQSIQNDVKYTLQNVYEYCGHFPGTDCIVNKKPHSNLANAICIYLCMSPSIDSSLLCTNGLRRCSILARIVILSVYGAGTIAEFKLLISPFLY
jgi:hypothetical protein